MQQTAPVIYTRDNPSPRYRTLIAQYQQLHTQGVPEHGLTATQTFPGQSLLEHVSPLLDLFAQYHFSSMLDYGCGKAMLYRPNNAITLEDGRRFDCLQALFGVPVTLYDPAYLPYSQRPRQKGDLVVCTDVLEHCSEEDVHWIVADLFDYANMFVYANIACYPAAKTLPNGENAHCTIRDTAWWRGIIEAVAGDFPAIKYRFICTTQEGAQRIIAN